MLRIRLSLYEVMFADSLYYLGCGDPALVEFGISRSMVLARSTVRTLSFGRVNFQMSKELMNEMPWKTVLRGKGAEQSCQLFKDTFLRVQSSPSQCVRNQARQGRHRHG